MYYVYHMNFRMLLTPMCAKLLSGASTGTCFLRARALDIQWIPPMRCFDLYICRLKLNWTSEIDTVNRFKEFLPDWYCYQRWDDHLEATRDRGWLLDFDLRGKQLQQIPSKKTCSRMFSCNVYWTSFLASNGLVFIFMAAFCVGNGWSDKVHRIAFALT